MADLLLSLLAKDEASKAFGDFAGVARRVQLELTNIIKMSVEAERVEKQLALVAGQLTDVHVRRAKALSQELAVDNQLIQRMQTMLLRYGEAPAKVEATVRAVLDYAAATGKDAVQATEALMKGVDAGNGRLAELGVTYKATGKSGDDLALATAALAKKFGGAGETDANSLAGAARLAKIQVEDLEKAVGSFFLKLEQKYELGKGATKWLQGLTQAMDDDSSVGGAANYLGASLGTLFGSDTAASYLDKYQTHLAGKNADASAADLRKLVEGGGGGVDHAVGRQGGAGDRVSDLDRLSRAKQLEKDLREMEDAEERYNERLAKAEQTRLKRALDEQQKLVDQAMDSYQAYADAREQAQIEDDERLLRENKQAQDKLREEEEAWREAGMRIGAAMTTAFMNELSQLAAGGEFDVGAFFGDMLSIVLGGLGAMVPGAGPILGALGTGIGQLVKAGTRKRRHEGGWVERFHDGGWPGGIGYDEQPAILQRGERVLSRREVASMGGPSGVDAAARGGGGTVVVQAIDGDSIQRLFEGRGGRALLNAVRLGRGSAPLLFSR